MNPRECSEHPDPILVTLILSLLALSGDMEDEKKRLQNFMATGRYEDPGMSIKKAERRKPEESQKPDPYEEGNAKNTDPDGAATLHKQSIKDES